MVRVATPANATTTLTIPAWAPDIRYASTGAGSRTLECLCAGTTLGGLAPLDNIQAVQVDLRSYSARKVMLAKNTTTAPIQVTLRYDAIGELTR